MAANIMDCYIAVNGMNDEAVKKAYGVSKANTLKVLKKLLIDELKSDLTEKKAPAARKPRKARGPRKPRKNSAKTVETQA
jgi:hypothetical protein